MFRYDGHSGGVTPGPIPNPEVKSARVSVCTVLRKVNHFSSPISWPRGFSRSAVAPTSAGFRDSENIIYLEAMPER